MDHQVGKKEHPKVSTVQSKPEAPRKKDQSLAGAQAGRPEVTLSTHCLSLSLWRCT